MLAYYLGSHKITHHKVRRYMPSQNHMTMGKKVSNSLYSVNTIFNFSMWDKSSQHCWKYFTCETRSHIDKIVACWFAHISVVLIFILPYGFGKQWTSPSTCASQHIWPVDLWAQAHRCPVSTRVDHGEITWRIVIV